MKKSSELQSILRNAKFLEPLEFKLHVWVIVTQRHWARYATPLVDSQLANVDLVIYNDNSFFVIAMASCLIYMNEHPIKETEMLLSLSKFTSKLIPLWKVSL